MPTPKQPKIYHICHVDRLASIITDGCLWCDAKIAHRDGTGTAIGMQPIKTRRMTRLTLASHPGLHVGDCVPFYFCPRSVMLYLIHQANHPELEYRGGQEPVVHLEADLMTAVRWANASRRRWAFTLSNAGAFYFEDRSDLAQLPELDWDAIMARQWSGIGVDARVKEGKQAEFLVENSFPWKLIERIGVHSQATYRQVGDVLAAGDQRPHVSIEASWYY